jgi:hypothetical protein
MKFANNTADAGNLLTPQEKLLQLCVEVILWKQSKL